MKSKHSGQSLIEFLVCLKFFVLGLTLMLSLFYLIYSKYLSEYYLYRGLLCLETEGESSRTCKYKVTARLSQFLYYKKDLTINLYRSQRRNKAEASFLFFDQKITWSKQITKTK